MDLPLELREKIYEASIPPKVIFKYTSRHNLAATGDHKTILLDCEDSGGLASDLVGAVGYRIYPAPFSSLTCVSKAVQAEVVAALERRQKTRNSSQHLHDLIRRSFDKRRFVQPCEPDFLALCRNARFELDAFSLYCWTWLNDMPLVIRESITSIVVDLKTRAWARTTGPKNQWNRPFDVAPLFSTSTSSLGRFSLPPLPSLREVAVSLPNSNYRESELSCGWMLLEICDKLEKGDIDAVRLIYCEPWDQLPGQDQYSIRAQKVKRGDASVVGTCAASATRFEMKLEECGRGMIS